jgi:MoxR-like ATPase
MINPATGALVTEFGPLASAEIILLDEINRIPLKSQSAFLEGLQDRTVTVGKETYELPAFSFAIATMNPIELGQGTFPLSEAATDRFAIMVNIGYLPPEEEVKLVNFDFKRVRLNVLMSKERIIQLRVAIGEQVFCTRVSGSTSSGSWPRRVRTIRTPTGCSVPRRKWWSAASTSGHRRGPSSAGAGSRRCGRCS